MRSIAAACLAASVLAFAFWPINKNPWVFAVQCRERTDGGELTWFRSPHTRAESWLAEASTGLRAPREVRQVPTCDTEKGWDWSTVDAYLRR